MKKKRSQWVKCKEYDEYEKPVYSFHFSSLVIVFFSYAELFRMEAFIRRATCS